MRDRETPMSIAKIVAVLVERGEEDLADELVDARDVFAAIAAHNVDIKAAVSDNEIDAELDEAVSAEAGHHFFDGKNYYVDTAFINALGRFWPEGYKGMQHMGFGEFMIKLSDGTEIEFDRMRGKDFPGKSGRSHQVYDNKGGKGVKKMIQLAEKKGGSELVSGAIEDYEIDAELDEATAALTDSQVRKLAKDIDIDVTSAKSIHALVKSIDSDYGALLKEVVKRFK
jgi:hypothetical protein